MRIFTMLYMSEYLIITVFSASDDGRCPEDQEQASQEEAAVREHEHGPLQGHLLPHRRRTRRGQVRYDILSSQLNVFESKWIELS